MTDRTMTSRMKAMTRLGTSAKVSPAGPGSCVVEVSEAPRGVRDDRVARSWEQPEPSPERTPPGQARAHRTAPAPQVVGRRAPDALRSSAGCAPLAMRLCHRWPPASAAIPRRPARPPLGGQDTRAGEAGGADQPPIRDISTLGSRVGRLGADLRVAVAPCLPHGAEQLAQLVVVAPPRRGPRRSVPRTPKRQVKSMPSAVSRARVQAPQKGSVTDAMRPISALPSR